MKLTEAMAGATLLAFSNGATDIITTVVAASGDAESDDLAVGALFGASTFALTVILAVIIWARPGKIINDVKKPIFNLFFKTRLA
jgi:solute carrier family 24 (sodium/potassium/calcium exchanger), member 6